MTLWVNLIFKLAQKLTKLSFNILDMSIAATIGKNKKYSIFHQNAHNIHLLTCPYLETWSAFCQFLIWFMFNLWHLISYTLSCEYHVVRNRYSSCYSLVKIAFASICTCKNNRRIWRHNASASRSHDVTDQLWWRHNVKSGKTVPSDNGEMSDWWLFLAERCVQDIK